MKKLYKKIDIEFQTLEFDVIMVSEPEYGSDGIDDFGNDIW